jgi:hypothetical protein
MGDEISRKDPRLLKNLATLNWETGEIVPAAAISSPDGYYHSELEAELNRSLAPTSAIRRFVTNKSVRSPEV